MAASRLAAALDNNVFVSSLLSGHGSPAQVVRAWRGGRVRVVTSEALSTEVRRVFNYPRIQKVTRLDVAAIEQWIAELRREAEVVTPTRIVTVCRDPADNAVIDAAIAGAADYIVSGDRDLLDLGEFEGIRIVTPADFLEILVES